MNKLLDTSLTFVGIIYYYICLKYSFYRSEDAIKRYQYRKLKRLLIECSKNVPYYRDLFEKINFKPEIDFTSIEDLSKVPILDKKKVRGNPKAFINQKNSSNVLEFKTSGSSGDPFCSIVNFTQWIIEQSVVWRGWKLAGYKFRDKIAVLRSYCPEDSDPLIKFDRLRNFIYYSPFHLIESNMESYVNHMIANNVRFLRGYPSSLTIFAHYLKSKQGSRLRLKGIFTASEVLSPADRNLIEEVFGCEIFDYYGLAEQVVTFSECKFHSGLHNNHEYGYLELIEEEKTGAYKIIGTNLNNKAMPLIRYDTEDLVEKFSLSNCQCGYKSLSVDRVLGRADVFIITPDGGEIPTVNFYTVLEHFPVKSWQILQVRVDALEINFHVDDITNDKKTFIQSKVKEEFSKRLPQNMLVSTVFNKSFFQIAEGKKNAFVRLIDENRIS